MKHEMRELLRSMVIAWDVTESGAPTVEPSMPYGSVDPLADVMRIGRVSDRRRASSLHRRTEGALREFLRRAVITPGRYSYPNALRDLEESGITVDVFAETDRERHQSPDIGFEFTDRHRVLLGAATIRWNDWTEELGDDLYPVPGIDPKRPYGGMTDFHADMAKVLGSPCRSAAELEHQRTALQRLHEEMQAALQVFVRYAEIA